MGRPKKYVTEEARRNARLQQTRQNVRQHRERRRAEVDVPVVERRPQRPLLPLAIKPAPATSESEQDDSSTSTSASLSSSSSSPSPSLYSSSRATSASPLSLDFAAHSNLAPIDLSFGALQAIADACRYVVDYSTHVGILQRMRSTQRLVDIAFFALGAQWIVLTNPGMSLLRQQSHLAYAQTIDSFRTRLSEVSTYTPFETAALLLTAHALQFFETFSKSSTNTDWLMHTNAAGIIFRTAGPKAFRGECVQLLRDFSSAFINLSIFGRTKCFLDTDEWRTIPYQDVGTSQRDEFQICLARIGGLLAESDYYLSHMVDIDDIAFESTVCDGVAVMQQLLDMAQDLASDTRLTLSTTIKLEQEWDEEIGGPHLPQRVNVQLRGALALFLLILGSTMNDLRSALGHHPIYSTALPHHIYAQDQLDTYAVQLVMLTYLKVEVAAEQRQPLFIASAQVDVARQYLNGHGQHIQRREELLRKCTETERMIANNDYDAITQSMGSYFNGLQVLKRSRALMLPVHSPD